MSLYKSFHCGFSVSTAPRKKQSQRASDKPLTKNQRKKLKKKLKKQQKSQGKGEGEEEEEGGEREEGEAWIKAHHMDVVENGEVKKIEKSEATGRVVVNGQGGAEHGKEGEGSASEEDSEGEEGGAEKGARQPSEEEEELRRLWGPLKGPVQVKIADLGNACWVVSDAMLHNVSMQSD